MMNAFVFQSTLPRVVFGAGSLAQLPLEVERLGMGRVLVLVTPGQAATTARVVALLGQRCAGVFDRAEMHVPIETVALARDVAQRTGADGTLAIGGGSAIGLGKALALELDLPMLALPTTYAGSEMTTLYGITTSGLKRTGRDPCVMPRTVIYDPTLTLTLPVGLSAVSGLNALAHAVEGLYAGNINPITGWMAEEGIRALATGLPRVVDAPRDEQARADCLYGSWLCGAVLGAVDMGLHHKLCHTLGGSFNLPHAQTHAIVLPYAAAYNEQAAPQAMARVAAALGSARAPAGLQALARRLGAPAGLRDLGLQATDLDRAAELATQSPYANPRSVDRDAVRTLLEQAWAGQPL